MFSYLNYHQIQKQVNWSSTWGAHTKTVNVLLKMLNKTRRQTVEPVWFIAHRITFQQSTLNINLASFVIRWATPIWVRVISILSAVCFFCFRALSVWLADLVVHVKVPIYTTFHFQLSNQLNQKLIFSELTDRSLSMPYQLSNCVGIATSKRINFLANAIK